MKITIDTFQKEITLETQENLKEVLEFMQKHFPDDWAVFKVMGRTITVSIPFTQIEQLPQDYYIDPIGDLMWRTYNSAN